MITTTVSWPDQNCPEPMPETAIGRLSPEQAAQIAKQSADPWVHRSSGMRCRTCIWYVPKDAKPSYEKRATEPVQVGRCRRHAPTMGGYPVVYMTDWCGDHRLDENKI